MPIFFIFLMLSIVCRAQTAVEISGRVGSSDGVALPNANILLVVGNDTLLTTTGDNGMFSFRIAPTAHLQLIASHVGFDTEYITVEALNDTTVSIVLHLAGIQLGAAVVTGRSRALIGRSDFGIMRINAQRMSQIPSLLGSPDVIRMLQLMPGVQHSGEANGYLYVRGADPGHNLMLYNRVPVYGTSHLLGIFPFYNADHISHIHFDKSGSETQFGNRLSATIQALSPNELPDNISVRGNIGLVASQLTVSSPVGKRAAVYLSGRQTYIDQIITPLLNSAARIDIEDMGYSFSDANFTLLLRPADSHNIDVNAFASGDRFSIADERMLLDGLLRWSNNLGSARWEWQMGENLTFGNEVYISRYTNRLQVQQASIDLQVYSEILDWGAESSLNFKLGAIPFTAGARFARYFVRPQELSSENLANNNEVDNTVNARQLSVYVHSRLPLNENFSLDVGLRSEYYANIGGSRTADFQLEPRLKLNYTDHDNWTAYVSYARKNQYLHLITTASVGVPTDFWTASSEGIPAEQADNFAIGSNYRITSRLELSSGVFYSRLYNQLQYPFSILQFNEMTYFSEDVMKGKGAAYGAELMITKRGRLSGWVSYTWSNSYRTFSEINDGERFPSKFDRRHNLTVVGIYEFSERWTASLTQVFTSGSRFTAPTSWYFINNNPVKEFGKFNNAQKPNYKRTDISIDYHFKKTSRRESVLNFSVYNLFAIRNPIYVMLDIRASQTGNQINVVPSYKALYSILPSLNWRFRF